MRLRQIALVARDLERAVDDLCGVFGIEVAYRDPGVGVFGLHNAVMPIGDTFLEVVSPTRDDASAARFLARHGDGGYMVIVQSDDLAADRRRLEELSVRIVWETSFDDIATIHLHPRDPGGAIVSLDESRPPASWRWAGPRWEACARTDRVREISGVTLAARDPEALASRWGRVLDRPVARRGELREIDLDRGAIRFTPDRDGRGDGFAEIEIAAVDRTKIAEAARARGLEARDAAVRICGARFVLG